MPDDEAKKAEAKKAEAEKQWRRHQDLLNHKLKFHVTVSEKLMERSQAGQGNANDIAVAMEENLSDIDAVIEERKEHKKLWNNPNYKATTTVADVTDMKNAVAALSRFNGASTAAVSLMKQAVKLLDAV